MSRTSDVRRALVILFISFSHLLLLSSCGANASGPAHLPDDPNSEMITQPVHSPEADEISRDDSATSPTAAYIDSVLSRYQSLDPEHVIDTNLLKAAVLYFDSNKSKFANQSVITIIDFGKRSTERRLHIVDLKSGSVWSMPVAHGKGSDANADGFADSFSNKSGSNATSLGFYKGSETYIGKNGQSLRMDGLSSTNSNARSRAVVIHGAAYVRDEKVIQGRSWGCPAIPMPYRDKVLALLKGGSLIYAGDSRTK